MDRRVFLAGLFASVASAITGSVSTASAREESTPHQLSTTSRVLNSITRAADVAGADAIGDTGAGTSVSVVALAGDADTGGEPIGSAPCLSGPGQCLPRRQHRLARDSGLTDRQPFHLLMVAKPSGSDRNSPEEVRFSHWRRVEGPSGHPGETRHRQDRPAARKRCCARLPARATAGR